MLKLPQITLICVSTVDVEQAVEALKFSCKDIEFGAVKLVSHYIPENITDGISFEKISSFSDVDEWSHYIFYNLSKHVDTEFCLLIHADGFVVNPGSWKDEFLNYDFIGAPFPEAEGVYVDKTDKNIRVGNSVSIRSKRLLDLPIKENIPWEMTKGDYNEDMQICVYQRDKFETYGIKFAPIEVASHFSHEANIPEIVGVMPFAFHKYHTKEHPNWELPRLPETKLLSKTYASFINLSHRGDRLVHMESQLAKIGLKAERFEAYRPNQFHGDKYNVMYNRTKGAIGCYESQMEVMRIALSKNKHALVMEDDCIFCDDFNERLKLFEGSMRHQHWDILWLGGTYHLEPTWHKQGHPQLPLCDCKWYRDYENAGGENIVRTFGCWSTYAYIVNVNSIDKVLYQLEKWIPQSIGIDYSMILMQPYLHTFAFNPGMVKQLDNQSDIGTGITKFSNFEKLGEHWYKQKM